MASRTRAAQRHGSEENASESSRIYQEGIIAGALGGATIAVFFLILDAVQGRPLYTPTVLGTVLFRGGSALGPPDSVAVSLEMVLVFTWLHFLVFGILGGIAAHFLAIAERRPNFGFGIILLFVIFEFGFISVAAVFAQEVLDALAWPAVLVGNLLAAFVMALYFRRRHPRLAIRP